MEVVAGPRLQSKRRQGAAALVADSRLLLAGGGDHEREHVSTEVLNLKEYAISPTPWINLLD